MKFNPERADSIVVLKCKKCGWQCIFIPDVQKKPPTCQGACKK